jgi:hypothetical protein
VKLQLWTTAATGDADTFLGEVEVDDKEWHDAQCSSGSALELIRTLVSEVDGGAG